MWRPPLQIRCWPSDCCYFCCSGLRPPPNGRQWANPNAHKAPSLATRVPQINTPGLPCLALAAFCLPCSQTSLLACSAPFPARQAALTRFFAGIRTPILLFSRSTLRRWLWLSYLFFFPFQTVFRSSAPLPSLCWIPFSAASRLGSRAPLPRSLLHSLI